MGVMFSTCEMANRGTLKFYLPRNFMDPGHFIFFNFCLVTKKVKCIDSQDDSLSSSRYFCESTMRTLFSYVLRAMSYDPDTQLSTMRGFLPQVSLKRTAKQQISLECGVISAFNLILSLRYKFDFLNVYTFENYQRSVSNIKPLLLNIIFHGSVSFESIKEI